MTFNQNQPVLLLLQCSVVARGQPPRSGRLLTDYIAAHHVALRYICGPCAASSRWLRLLPAHNLAHRLRLRSICSGASAQQSCTRSVILAYRSMAHFLAELLTSSLAGSMILSVCLPLSTLSVSGRCIPVLCRPLTLPFFPSP